VSLLIKLKFNRAGFDPNGLHEELGDLGGKYYLTHTESEITLMFPELVKLNIYDDEANLVRVEYEKRWKETVIIDDKEVELVRSEHFDFATLESTIDGVKNAHDPLKRQNRLDNERLLKEIAETDSEFVRLVEDIADFLETNHGFAIPQAQKDRMAERANKRSQLQGV
jgi:hypothetical protein